MGMAFYVYPGAVHTRFHHSLGACHLMGEALKVLRIKGHSISDDTILSAQIAILLHDIGHGPFSHALEHELFSGGQHEDISLAIMHKLNEEFGGQLSEAIDIFTKKHPIKFLSQLVSGQLDMDRMDYLNRDSFYSGVTEGVIGYDRILQMLEVVDNELVVEEKGIHSVEKFLIARRMMYWQVYLHKTVLSAELLLIQIMRRARSIFNEDMELYTTRQLTYFLKNNYSISQISDNPQLLENFLKLGDDDVLASIKMWSEYPDNTLSYLCKMFINRNLYKISLSNIYLEETYNEKYNEISSRLKAMGLEPKYFILHGETENKTYNSNDIIKILLKNGEVKDISDIAHTLITPDIAQSVKRYYLAIDRNLV